MRKISPKLAAALPFVPLWLALGIAVVIGIVLVTAPPVPDWLSFIQALLVLVFIVTIAAFLIHGTVRKTRWGVNFRRVSCPRCTTVIGRFRRARSGQQAFWGGYTCANCGCEMDKWGREIVPLTQS